jgi:hypothetical protein
MTSPEPGGAAQNFGEAVGLEQPCRRSWPSTRREWLLNAGTGFGGLALVDLLSLTVSEARTRICRDSSS